VAPLQLERAPGRSHVPPLAAPVAAIRAAASRPCVWRQRDV